MGTVFNLWGRRTVIFQILTKDEGKAPYYKNNRNNITILLIFALSLELL